MSNRNDTAVMLLHNPSADESVRSANDPSTVDVETSVSRIRAEAEESEVAPATDAKPEPEAPQAEPAQAIESRVLVDALAQAAAEPRTEESPAPAPVAQPAASHAEEGDEWADLSTKWLVALGGQECASESEPHPDADWAASLSAQLPPSLNSRELRDTREARPFAPPPPPNRRSSAPPTPRHGTLQARPTLPPPAPRFSTLAGMQPVPDARVSTPKAEPNPWREEPSYTSSRQPQPERPSWAGAQHPSSQIPLPPWAATLPPYPPPAWAPHLAPQAAAAWAATVNPPAVQPPRRNTFESGVEQWTSLGNVWLTSVAKLALAAMALQYSGLAEPILARFGYAPAAAQAAQIVPAPSDPVRIPALATLAPPMPPAVVPPAAAMPILPEPAPSATVHKPAAVKRSPSTAAKTRRAAEPADASAAPQPAIAAHAAEPAGEATLRINSRPWSQVFVDGTLVGNTPRLNLRVSAGSHSIRLVNPDLSLSKTIELSPAAGETISRVELLEQ